MEVGNGYRDGGIKYKKGIELVSLLEGKQLVGLTKRYKARLVVKDFTQTNGIDY